MSIALKKKKVYRVLKAGLLLLLAPAALMRAEAQQLEEMRQKYPQDKAVFLEQRQEVLLDMVGDSIRVVSKHYSDMLHLADKTSNYAINKVYVSHFYKLLKIDARTLIPAGKSYKPKKVSDFSEKFEISSGIFYDDSKSVSFMYPAVEPGVRTVLDYTEEITDPRFMHSFYFGSFIPVEKAELVLTVHKNIDITHQLFHMNSKDLEFSKTDKGKYTIYRWKASNLPAFSREEDTPTRAYFMPHLFYRVTKGNCGSKPCKQLGSLQDLYSMYWGFIKDINKEESPRLKLVTDSLTAGIKQEEDKVRAIFYWVQNNIKYIAFENGMRGFIPHNADLVYEKRYGDCKDMASILYQMLRMAGIKSYLTWIGTRDLPYRYTEVPSPIVDNHMITTYEKNGRYYFLDATSSHTPLGMPSAMIQGKEALLSIDSATYKVVEVPVLEKEANLIQEQYTLKLDGGTIKGSGKLLLKGYPQIMETYRINDLDQEKQSSHITAILSKGNNKYFVDNYKINQIRDNDKPLEIQYDYRLEDYARLAGNEVYINMSLDKFLFNEQLDLDKRKLPLSSEYRYTQSHRTTLEIPAGYEIGYLPENTSVQQDLLSFNIRYRKEKNQVIQEKDIYINHIMLEKEQFQDWNNVIQKLNEAYREVVILKKKTNTKAAK